jgi:hypothetical protein
MLLDALNLVQFSFLYSISNNIIDISLVARSGKNGALMYNIRMHFTKLFFDNENWLNP